MGYKLSICMPTYNREKQLVRQLHFLEKERIFSNKLVEVIISNNASTDNSKDILAEFSKKFDCIKVNNNIENIGAINNIHKLISMSTGEYIWIIGDDDMLYPGILEKVLNVLNVNRDIHHIFINHRTVFGNKIVSNMVYKGEEGFRISKENLVLEFDETLDFGNYMFITANIWKRSDVLFVNEILKINNELDNYALPLGYSLYCSFLGTYVVNDVFIDNEWKDASWSNQAIKVHARDMICVIDIIAKNFNMEDTINPILFNHLPLKYPEVIYSLKGKKFKKNNYAMKWMKENYKNEIVLDYIKYVFCAIKSKILSK